MDMFKALNAQSEILGEVALIAAGRQVKIEDQAETITLLMADLELLLNFAYGYTGTEEGYGQTEVSLVEALRRAAVFLGRDPIEVTPFDHRERFNHAYFPEFYRILGTMDVHTRCKHCYCRENHEVHGVV